MQDIYKGDDTHAFNQDFLKINANIPEGYTVSKAEFKCGKLPLMTFLNPVFPLIINLTAVQTASLSCMNECFLAVYDENNLKQTCSGSLVFHANKEVVK